MEKEFDWKDGIPPLTEEQKLGLKKNNPMIRLFKKIGINLEFKWFDLWIGLFIDRKSKIYYFCPFPTIVISFWKMP